LYPVDHVIANLQGLCGRRNILQKSFFGWRQGWTLRRSRFAFDRLALENSLFGSFSRAGLQPERCCHH
jgi:hypothetical protein